MINTDINTNRKTGERKTYMIILVKQLIEPWQRVCEAVLRQDGLTGNRHLTQEGIAFSLMFTKPSYWCSDKLFKSILKEINTTLKSSLNKIVWSIWTDFSDFYRAWVAGAVLQTHPSLINWNIKSLFFSKP